MTVLSFQVQGGAIECQGDIGGDQVLGFGKRRESESDETVTVIKVVSDSNSPSYGRGKKNVAHRKSGLYSIG